MACRPRAQRLPARLPPPGGRRPRLWELLPGPPLGPAALTEQPVPCCQVSLSAGHSCDRPPVGVPRVHRHATVGPGLGGPRAVGWAGSGTLCSSATRAPAAPSSVCVPSCPQAVGSAPASPRQPGCAGFLGPDSSYGWDVGVDPASSRAGVPLPPLGPVSTHQDLTCFFFDMQVTARIDTLALRLGGLVWERASRPSGRGADSRNQGTLCWGEERGAQTGRRGGVLGARALPPPPPPPSCSARGSVAG